MVKACDWRFGFTLSSRTEVEMYQTLDLVVSAVRLAKANGAAAAAAAAAAEAEGGAGQGQRQKRLRQKCFEVQVAFCRLQVSNWPISKELRLLHGRGFQLSARGPRVKLQGRTLKNQPKALHQEERSFLQTWSYILRKGFAKASASPLQCSTAASSQRTTRAPHAAQDQLLQLVEHGLVLAHHHPNWAMSTLRQNLRTSYSSRTCSRKVACLVRNLL